MKGSFKLLVDEFNDIKSILKREPSLDEYKKYTIYGREYLRIFGSFGELKRIAAIGMETIFSDPPETKSEKPEKEDSELKKVKKTKEDLINLYRAFVKENGHQPTLKEYKKYAHCAEKTISDRCGSYADLVREAGYKPLPRSIKKPQQKKAEAIKKVIKQSVYINYNKRYPIKHDSTSTLLKWARRRRSEDELK